MKRWLFMQKKKRSQPDDLRQKLPGASDWRTTDEDEINKRRVRAHEESFRIINQNPAHPIFSNFEVHSGSGMKYQVELRDIMGRHFSCTCTDFRINGLGTCKHIEAVMLHLARRQRAHYKGAAKMPSSRVDIVVDGESGRLRAERNAQRLPGGLRDYFDRGGLALLQVDPEELVGRLEASRSSLLRISQDVHRWIEMRARDRDRVLARRDYETGVREGRHPEHVTKSPLFPYQREGMLHLAFTERALLADEMGLGKTIQAIAAAALLHHLGKANRVLVVAPASLKSEWEEQIQRFTDLGLRLVFGGKSARAQIYRDPAPPFFTIMNYEQVLNDSLDINQHLRPDVIILDEAQRIKNWSTKTAQAVKRLESRHAFILTGTPIENRIDELRSLVDFLDPALLGPLFRFNREYYELDERGRPAGYKNLDLLRERVRPILLRRRKAQVETELPDRTDRNLFVALTPSMRREYGEIERMVGDLVAKAKRRPLTPREQDLLMILLNMMRMICDSPGLIKKNPSTECPKMEELARILEEALSEDETKVIIFSEWTGMLEKVRAWADKNGIGYAWHTGSVEQRRRRAEINTFRSDPACRLFLSTDSGGVGLNLQNASVVINCDLPWNPAKLEQRIARAWRKGQLQPVTVINLVAENTIEHGMLATLDQKARLAEGVLDGGDLSEVRLKSGRQALLKRLEQILTATPKGTSHVQAMITDPSRHFAQRAQVQLGARLVHCEESYAPGQEAPVLFAVVSGSVMATDRETLSVLHREAGWPGGAAPALHLLDSTAWEAIQSLAASGFITIHTRARRPLLVEEGQVQLTPEQLAEIRNLREGAEKKRRAAAALEAAGLPEEAEPLARLARELEAKACAIEKPSTS